LSRLVLLDDFHNLDDLELLERRECLWDVPAIDVNDTVIEIGNQ
jgi:hypothetical protein